VRELIARESSPIVVTTNELSRRVGRERHMLASMMVAFLLSGAPANAAEWNQWRGPGRDATTLGATGSWPANLKRLWRTDLGSGQSSPVVAGNDVFLFSRQGDMEVVHALDLQTGRLRWRQGYKATYEVYPGAVDYGKGPRSTPVVQDGRLFTLGISGILSAFDASTGRLLWQKDFAGRFPATSPPFGTSMSPLMADGLLIVHAGGHQGGAVIAFDPASGNERWSLDGDGPSYSSPILATLLGQEQLVIQVHRKLLGIDPVAGRVLWSVPFVTPCDQNIVTPLQVGDRILVSSLDKGTMAIELTRSGSEWVPRVAWHTAAVSMYMSSPVLANGSVVGLSEGAQGENAALVVTGESLLVLHGDGTLLVMPDDAAGFAPVREYKVADSATFAHPVPTRLGVLIRDQVGLALFTLLRSAHVATNR
jgi:outer membrane protein assembly factor BamB